MAEHDGLTERRSSAVAEQIPRPGNLWIRFVPRAWPAQGFAWTNLATATVGLRRAAVGLPRLGAPLDDVLWVPPVAAGGEAPRDGWLAPLAAGGTPLLVQVVPGTGVPPLAGAVVWDLLEPLLAGDLDLFDVVPPGAHVVWPLLPGEPSHPELVERGCARLAAAGAVVAQGMALELPPATRRELATRLGEGAFHSLFHGPAPSERDFAVVAARHGLAPFVPRPEPPGGAPANRRLAETMALAAELWLRLGRPLGRGGELLRAARWIDDSPHDLVALWRDGNLGVLDWLDPVSRELVAAWCSSGRLPLVDDLMDEYLSEEAL